MGKWLNNILIKAKDEFLDIIYPPGSKCIICNEDYIGLCPICYSKIQRVKKSNKVLSYGYYTGILKNLILEFKYNRNFVAGAILVEFLEKLIRENDINIDYIMYIPSSKKSIKNRGFNQCEYLAVELKKKLNIEICRDILKSNNIREQKLLSKEERVENIRGAFKLKSNKNIKDKNLLLIDDVMTTGATLFECEKLLIENGANSIKLLTVAKTYI